MSEQGISPAAEKTFTALIVDDYQLNRQLFQLALKSVGYNTTHAENGLHCLNILNCQTFDLLVLDLAMPFIDGTEVLKRIRQQPEHDNMVVIVVTANPHMSVVEVDDLADYIMFKPLDIVAFCEFVERLKDKHA